MAKNQGRHTVRKALLLLWNFMTIPIVIRVGRLNCKFTLRELLLGFILKQLVSILLF